MNDHYVGLDIEITTTPELTDEFSPEFWMSSHDFNAWNGNGKRVNDVVGNGLLLSERLRVNPELDRPGRDRQ